MPACPVCACGLTMRGKCAWAWNFGLATLTLKPWPAQGIDACELPIRCRYAWAWYFGTVSFDSWAMRAMGILWMLLCPGYIRWNEIKWDRNRSDQTIDWLSRSLTSREHASGYMRHPCRRHEMGCLLLLLLKPEGEKRYENHRHKCAIWSDPIRPDQTRSACDMLWHDVTWHDI